MYKNIDHILHKFLVTGKKDTGGRNRGLVSTKRRKAMVKNNYRYVDFKRVICEKKEMDLVCIKSYDPNRTAKLSITEISEKTFTFILGTEYIKNQKVVMNNQIPLNLKETGYSAKIKVIPLGTLLHNLELLPGMGGQIARAAGTSAILLKIVDDKALIKLKSGEHRYVSKEIMATFGVVGNHEHFLKKLKKAGDTRLRGFRARVRPSMMNPVDHPMGGRTKGGCAPKSATGKLSHGPSTMKKKAHKLTLITSRKTR